jgi:hypothetical protein
MSPIMSSFGGGSGRGFGRNFNPGSSGLYAFTNHTFTSANLTGPTGPTLEQCKTAYSSQPWAQNSSFFNMTIQGIQEWRVPVTGSYRITAAGPASSSRRTSGRGVIYSGDFLLNENEVIRILVGQMELQNSANTPTGGGGGTFVVRSPYNTNASIIVIAGGGGGTHDTTSGYNQTTADATYSTTGNSGTPGGFTGGSNGQGGGHPNNSNGASAGAGFFGNGNGRTMFPSSDGSLPQSFVNGGIGGGIGGSSSTKGGFGGGGFTWFSTGWGGGGGGYSGGGTISNSSYNGNAGGGGSYNNGTNQQQLGINSGSGYVTITKL